MSDAGRLLRYVARRVIQCVPLVVAVIVLNFVLIKTAPGDPVSYIAPEGASVEYRQRISHELGLDRPVQAQLVSYISDVAHLDLGYSIAFRSPVWPLIQSRIPATALLSGTGLLLGTSIGVILGIFAGQRPGGILDRLSTSLALFGFSMPSFWVAQLVLLVFALELGWLPDQGIASVRSDLTGLAAAPDVLWHLILPALTFAIYPVALVFRLTRAKTREALNSDFVLLARAKGLSSRRVTLRHALPNATLPVITVIGYNFGYVLAGAVLIETVFGWPGIGLLLSTAVAARDYPLLLGLFMVTTVMVVLANIVTDVACAAIDPRIR